MNVVLIDDEPDARFALRTLLAESELSFLISEAGGVREGLDLIRSVKPEIVFLDVMMKDGTGFDLLKQLPTIDFKLVIVSGHNEFALQAFRFSAIDYLVKPVDADELQSTLARIKSAQAQSWQQVWEVLKQHTKPDKASDKKIVLRDLNSIFIVEVNSIVRCTATDNYTTFYTTDQQPIIVSKPLKEYDELLAPFDFLRVHQSHLINLNHVQQINKREGGSVKMKDGSEVPISTRKRDLLLTKISKFS